MLCKRTKNTNTYTRGIQHDSAMAENKNIYNGKKKEKKNAVPSLPIHCIPLQHTLQAFTLAINSHKN
jgi:hypothetical protein